MKKKAHQPTLEPGDTVSWRTTWGNLITGTVIAFADAGRVIPTPDCGRVFRRIDSKKFKTDLRASRFPFPEAHRRAASSSQFKNVGTRVSNSPRYIVSVRKSDNKIYYYSPLATNLEKQQSNRSVGGMRLEPVAGASW